MYAGKLVFAQITQHLPLIFSSRLASQRGPLRTASQQDGEDSGEGHREHPRERGRDLPRHRLQGGQVGRGDGRRPQGQYHRQAPERTARSTSATAQIASRGQSQGEGLVWTQSRISCPLASMWASDALRGSTGMWCRRTNSSHPPAVTTDGRANGMTVLRWRVSAAPTSSATARTVP